MGELDLADIRDRLRRARLAEEPFDAADQWAALGGDVPALLEEVKRLRGLLRDVDLFGQGFVYSPAGREPLTLHPSDVTVYMRADAVTAHEAALKVVAAAEELADAHRAVQRAIVSGEDRNDVDLARGFAMRHVAEAVDEWRDRGE